MLLALAVTFAARPADILIHEDADLVAMRIAGGEAAFSSLRRGRFLRENWLAAMGEPLAVAWPSPGSDLAGNTLRCDSLGCLYRPPDASGVTVAIAEGVDALSDDCWSADLIISLVPVRRDCPAALGVIDRFDLWRFGTHALWFETGGVRVRTVQGERGIRPWSPGVDED